MASALNVVLNTFWISSTILAILAIPRNSFLNRWSRHGKMVCEKGHKDLIPKRYFSHFYLYGLAATWILAGFHSLGPVLLGLHLYRRLIEQTCLFPYSESSRMHVSAYFFGFAYYTAVALTVPPRPSSVMLFVIGNFLQFVSHHSLHLNRWIHQSEEVKKRPPDSVWFRYMNCPHYFAEMLIYVSLASTESIPSMLCALFVIVSLSVNWRNQSLWYLKSS